MIVRAPQGKNSTRWPIANKWEVVQSARVNQSGSELVRNRVKKGELNRLAAQAAGLHLSIAAKGNRHDSEETAELVRRVVEANLRKKGRTFDEEKAIRRQRYLE